MLSKPLSEAEYDTLQIMLDRFHEQNGMNLEQVDGFFAALISGPETVSFDEQLSEIYGNWGDENAFANKALAEEFITLLNRHWNTCIQTLTTGSPFSPILLESDEGIAKGNDWAHGFHRGMNIYHDAWLELLRDEERGVALLPILTLLHENDPTPETHLHGENSLSTEQREQLITALSAGITSIFHYFEPHRRKNTQRASTPKQSTRLKIGRNDPCPCGSGKKYKHCCLNGPTLH